MKVAKPSEEYNAPKYTPQPSVINLPLSVNIIDINQFESPGRGDENIADTGQVRYVPALQNHFPGLFNKLGAVFPDRSQPPVSTDGEPGDLSCKWIIQDREESGAV